MVSVIMCRAGLRQSQSDSYSKKNTDKMPSQYVAKLRVVVTPRMIKSVLF